LSKKRAYFLQKKDNFEKGGQLSTGLLFSAEIHGQLSTTGNFKPGSISTGQLSTNKVFQ